MTGSSRKWNSSAAIAGIQGEVAAMMQGGFRLVGAVALLYISNVYWEAPKVQADETTKIVHNLLGTLNYGKSSKYQLASAGMALARNMTRKYGAPDAAKERNVAWHMLQDADTFSDAVDMIVSEIKTTYGVDTLAGLYAALSSGKATGTGKAEKPLTERVMAAIAKEELGTDGVAHVATHVASSDPAVRMLTVESLLKAMSFDELTHVGRIIHDLQSAAVEAEITKAA